MNTNRPEHKVVVITGGSSGISYAVAENLLQKKPGSTVQYYSCDVSDFDTVKDTVQKLFNSNRGIDQVINYARNDETGASSRGLCRLCDAS